MQRDRVMAALAALFGVVVALAGAEAGLRLLDGAPTVPEPAFTVEPADWLAANPDFGWSLRPGAARLTFSDGYSVTATHDARGQRRTPPGRGEVVELHGGSFAYGLGLADEDTLGWRLQELLPDHDVRVRAVPGHSPLQAWLALQDHAREGTVPAGMVVTYAEFHDERVTMNRSWRRALQGTGFADDGLMPAVRTRRGVPYVDLVDPRFQPMRGARSSAVLARVCLTGDLLDEQRVRSWRVTGNLLIQLDRLARQHGTWVLVVGLSDDGTTRLTLRKLEAAGVRTLDAGLDWTDRVHQLWPHDHHPNAAAADHWARAVAEAVKGE